MATAVEIEFTPLEEFEFWLDDMEIKLSSTLGRPKSREDAKYIVNVAKKLLRECEKKELPEELKEREKKRKSRGKAYRVDEKGWYEEDLDECPEEEDDEEDEEEEEEELSPKAEDLKNRYKLMRASLDDNLSKAENLCECWDKLKEDMSKLKEAISTGGSGSKLTMTKLEIQINQIKRTLREKASLVEDLGATGGAA